MARASRQTRAPSQNSNDGSEPNTFHTALVHLYRAEMQRMTVWGQRLDTTSNWGMLLITGMATFTLGAEDVPHFTMLLGLVLLGICLQMEARRYQHLHHSYWRIGLIESGYFDEMLDAGTTTGESAWREHLMNDLKSPYCSITWFQAIRLRLRRHYLMLVYFSTGVWIAKLAIHPTHASQASEVYERLAVGNLLPNWFVATSAVLFVIIATVLAVTVAPDETPLGRRKFRAMIPD